MCSVFAATQAADVKTYLVTTVEKMDAASADFVVNAEAYAALIQKYGGDYAAAYKAEPREIDSLITRMQGNYKAMDSFGYETVEGIVAGVDGFVDYDIYLDAGVPASEGPDGVSPLVLTLADGSKIDREGASFTYIIEPALWAGNKRWTVEVDRDGDGNKNAKEALPRAEVLVAVALDTRAKIAQLLADAKDWNATTADCFGAMIAMTPTLSDYFEDWKESRYGDAASGRFQAVSRLSDMRGIMQSCVVMYGAVKGEIAQKDKALAKSVDQGFIEILAFLDVLEAREKENKITASEIDELADQAKGKTDKIVPQIEQGAAILGVKTSG